MFFVPKFKRQVIYGAIKTDLANILITLCKRKGVEIIEAECCLDHIRMLVRIPSNIIVSEFVVYLKAKSKKSL
jgi:REP element-mobilizing transposase RayT